jgi:hypothetical protein
MRIILPWAEKPFAWIMPAGKSPQAFQAQITVFF